MISNRELKEFFLEDGTPNWEKYCASYNRMLSGRGEIRDIYFLRNVRSVLKHVDFYYCLKGFLTIRGGYDLIGSENSPLITFNRINDQRLRFAREEYAEKVGEIIGPQGYHIMPAQD